MKLPDKMVSSPVLSLAAIARRMHMPNGAGTYQGQTFLAHIILHNRLLHLVAACAKS